MTGPASSALAWRAATGADVGPWPAPRSVTVLLVAGALSLNGTTAHNEMHNLQDAVIAPDTSTTTGAPAVDAGILSEETRGAVSELRRLGGLTWEQVARLFGVSRRSVHFWASGKPMTAEHEEHLHRVLGLLRGRRGDAEQIRGALLSVVGGKQVLELLVEHRYEEVAAALGGESRPSRAPLTSLSPEAEAARRPPPPEFLAGSEEEVGHEPLGRARPARIGRSKGRGNT